MPRTRLAFLVLATVAGGCGTGRDAVKPDDMSAAQQTTFRGISARPAGGEPVTFSLVGDLTVHGTTRPTEWNVIAHAEGADIVGTATTAFTFKDMGLDQPRVPVVLSVADTIKLEYDFRFTPAPKSP